MLQKLKVQQVRKRVGVVGMRYPLDVAEALGKVGDHQRFIRAAVEKELRAQSFLPSSDDVDQRAIKATCLLA